MAQAKPIDLIFERERETKNKVRFQEQGKKEELITDKLYVTKKALKSMGDPTTLHVNISPA